MAINYIVDLLLLTPQLFRILILQGCFVNTELILPATFGANIELADKQIDTKSKL